MGVRIFPEGVTLDGLDLSGVDGNGVAWIGSSVDGWLGSPASTLALTQKASGAGAWATLNPQLTPRVLALTGTIACDDRNLVSRAVDSLMTACDLAPVLLQVTEGGRTRWAWVQRSDEVLVDDSIGTAVNYSLQVTAADPLKYGASIVSTTGLPATSGGLTLPTSVPFSITSTVVSGQAVAVNTGNATGTVVLRIDGPITAPIVTHVGSGAQLVFSSSLALLAGQWLTIDMQAHTVLANDTASRSQFVTSRGWSGFDPGPNTWALSSPVASSTAKLTVTAVEAWR